MILIRKLALAAALFSLAFSFSAGQAQAGGKYARADRKALRYSAARPWHGDYAHTSWGTPIALVTPPNAKMITSMGWGVTATEINPLYHQFRRDYPGQLDATGGRYLPTPAWPSHTDQFGVYPVRGPW